MNRLARFIVRRFPVFARAVVVAAWVERFPGKPPEDVTVFDALRAL